MVVIDQIHYDCHCYGNLDRAALTAAPTGHRRPYLLGAKRDCDTKQYSMFYDFLRLICKVDQITKRKCVFHYYRIHHRKRPITAGLFRTGGDRLSPPVPNEPGGDAYVSPPVRNTTQR